jgi:hypothetical protein
MNGLDCKAILAVAHPATCWMDLNVRLRRWPVAMDIARGLFRRVNPRFARSFPRDHNLPEGILNGFESLITRPTFPYQPCGAYSFPWR